MCLRAGPGPGALIGAAALFFAVVVAVLSRGADALSCDAVRPSLEEGGVPAAHLLDHPVAGIGPGGACGCCSSAAAAKFATKSRESLERVVTNHAQSTRTSFVTMARQYDSLFMELSEQSKKGLHEMFKRTYGLIYENHAHLFSDLFVQLEQYYTRGGLDLARVMDDFFSILYKKMFTVLNSQYHFDEKYLNCVSTHMKELQPFGDVPGKLTVQIKRSYVATRTFTHALKTAGEVAVNIANNIKVPSWCEAQKHCSKCSGVNEKPCAHLCLNIARGCLPQYADLSLDWDAFVDAMDKVVDRLLGSFNIVNVVEPIDIKISEAIMNFQDQSQELSNRVFTGCGKPVLGQKPSDSNYFSHSRQIRSASFGDMASKDVSDDFEIETSYESLLNKNPFLLSRGSSRKYNSGEEITDFKSGDNLNIDISNENDFKENNGFDILKNIDKRYASKTYDMLRYKREAAPEPDRKSKEIEFEEYNFNNEPRNKGKKKNNRKNKGGTRKPNIESIGSSETREEKLDILMREIHVVVSKTRHSWALLPHQYCHIDSTSINYGSDDNCWNGTHVARYMLPLAGEGTAALATNPEVRGSTSNGAYSPTVSYVMGQQLTLRKLTNNLKNAFNGYDVHLDNDEEVTSWGIGSGSGSGSDTDDSEDRDPIDQEKDNEGSGHHHSIPNFDTKYPNQDITEKYFHPSVVIKHPDINEIERKTVDSEFDHEEGTNHIDANSEKEAGTVSGVEKQEMSLQRALITYLFPIVCVWFGGIITDIA